MARLVEVDGIFRSGQMSPARVTSLIPYHWNEILEASQAEGYGMVRRLLDDFRAGSNRFDAPGEALFAHLQGETVVAVAGLNIEPDPGLGRGGRVRRLYVLPHHRGNGLARSLMDEITSFAAGKHGLLTVNAGKLARGFYEHLGFMAVEHPGITHVKELPPNR